MKKEVYKGPGRPLMGEEGRKPVHALVKPSTIEALDAWGPSRGICIDNLVEREIERLYYNSKG